MGKRAKEKRREVCVTIAKRNEFKDWESKTFVILVQLCLMWVIRRGYISRWRGAHSYTSSSKSFVADRLPDFIPPSLVLLKSAFVANRGSYEPCPL